MTTELDDREWVINDDLAEADDRLSEIVILCQTMQLNGLIFPQHLESLRGHVQTIADEVGYEWQTCQPAEDRKPKAKSAFTEAYTAGLIKPKRGKKTKDRV